MCVSAGLVSLGAYIPAKAVSRKRELIQFLDYTSLAKEYIEEIEQNDKLPGRIETNFDGWEKQAWFHTWLNRLPQSKQKEPFQGSKERRRVPLDPESLANSIVPHPMLPSDAETLAASIALVNGNIKKNEIDLLITSSQVPDLALPPNASLVQHKLGLENAGAFEIDSCCSSFLTMLEVAEALVRSGFRKKVLIVASYIDSMVTDKSDYFSVNTGDAAVAAVVSQVEEGFGFQSSHSTSHGSRHNAIILQRRAPQLINESAKTSRYEQEFVTFYNPLATKEIAANSTRDMIEVTAKALSKAGLRSEDLDFLLTHQPVHWAANAWREALEFPKEKFYESFEKYGNIANCSAAVNLLEAIEHDLIQAGNRVLLASSGAGENHVAVVEKITPELICSVQGKQGNRVSFSEGESR